jgi:hypothetical protein
MPWQPPTVAWASARHSKIVPRVESCGRQPVSFRPKPCYACRGWKGGRRDHPTTTMLEIMRRSGGGLSAGRPDTRRRHCSRYPCGIFQARCRGPCHLQLGRRFVFTARTRTAHRSRSVGTPDLLHSRLRHGRADRGAAAGDLRHFRRPGRSSDRRTIAIRRSDRHHSRTIAAQNARTSPRGVISSDRVSARGVRPRSSCRLHVWRRATVCRCAPVDLCSRGCARARPQHSHPRCSRR